MMEWTIPEKATRRICFKTTDEKYMMNPLLWDPMSNNNEYEITYYITYISTDDEKYFGGYIQRDKPLKISEWKIVLGFNNVEINTRPGTTLDVLKLHRNQSIIERGDIYVRGSFNTTKEYEIWVRDKIEKGWVLIDFIYNGVLISRSSKTLIKKCILQHTKKRNSKS